MELLAGIEHFVDQFPGQCLEHGHLAHAIALLGDQPAAVVEELAGRMGLGLQHCQPLPDNLLVEEDAAKRFARLHMLDGQPQCSQAMAHCHRRGRNALGLEVLHDRVEPRVLLAQQVCRRNTAILEHQFRGVGTQPAGLVQRAANAKSRRALFHDEDGNATGSLCVRIGAYRDEVDIGEHSVGDEHLAAVEYPAVAIAPGACANAGHVGARIRLGDRHRSNLFAANDRWQVFLELRLRSGVDQMGRRHVRMHQNGHDKTAEGAA